MIEILLGVFQSHAIQAGGQPWSLCLHCIRLSKDQTAFETDWQLIDETASGVDVIKNNLINIYPNPAKDFIIISADDNNIEKVEITDLLGRLVFTDKSGATRLNLNDLKSGQYICRVWLSNQPIPKVARIIK